MAHREFNPSQAYEKAVEVLEKASNRYGFKASAVDGDRYENIWARDSMICSLAALMTSRKSLIKKVKLSLSTLLKFQHRHGNIPSNVNPTTKKASYGGTAGRVDANLWFVIGFAQYIKRTNDLPFLHKHFNKLRKTMSLVHLYEFNDKGFIYVPKGGDWADEYIQEGYVLYDEILYMRAWQEMAWLSRKMKKHIKKYNERAERAKQMILVNFWPERKHIDSEFVYHPTIFKKVFKQKRMKETFFLPYFNPSGYGCRFDGFGNSLALHLLEMPKQKEKKILNYILEQFSRRTKYLLPAFYPPIFPHENDWEELKANYSIKFRNKPHEYHNGGLWQMITGFFAAWLARHSPETAALYLHGINRANSLGKNGEKWQFYEFIHGKKLTPGGKPLQAWSAAATIMAHEAVFRRKEVFK
ncbi:glycogen debranching protein [Candidatus Pacearchaeota archaeon]|nr:MAG: glycogen debranching protein [Candidatus Pacearchaeota archaeon]